MAPVETFTELLTFSSRHPCRHQRLQISNRKILTECLHDQPTFPCGYAKYNHFRHAGNQSLVMGIVFKYERLGKGTFRCLGTVREIPDPGLEISFVELVSAVGSAPLNVHRALPSAAVDSAINMLLRLLLLRVPRKPGQASVERSCRISS